MTDRFFQWDQDFITGVDLIDAQHFSLIEIINNLLKTCFQTETINEEKIVTISTQLKDYTVDHFQSEEKIMIDAQVDPRHIIDHQKAHKEFVSKIQERFQLSESLSDPCKMGESVEFLIRWLAYHILYMDKNMVQQMNMIQANHLSAAEAYDRMEKMDKSTSEPLLKALKALFYIVSEKNKELEQQNFELEEKVLARTQALEKANEQLRQASLTDELTDLANRRYALSEIQKQIHTWERYDTPFSLLFIDLDGFKSVNDTFGHDAGDKVLQWIASFLSSHTRKTDIPCRLGGDEFIVICPNTALAGAEQLALNLKQELRLRIPDILQKLWNPSFSIGLAEMNPSISTASEILTIADRAMYKEKNRR